MIRKKYYWIITILLISLFIQCKKDYNDVKDISTLSLPDLKSTLNGNWRLIYTLGFYPGRKDYPNTNINFYNNADSLIRIDNGIETIKEKLTYIKIRNYFSGDSTYTFNGWSAEYIKNDTLLLRDQASEPLTYYLVH